MINKLQSKEDLFYAIIAIVFIWIISLQLDFFEILLEWLKTHEEYEVDEFIVLFIAGGIIFSWYAMRRYNEAKKVNEKLNDLNKFLKEKVQEELLKQQKQQELLLNQSRHAAMGEMIGNIAHQWRQPLNALGLVLQNIEFAYNMDDLNDEFMDKSINKSRILIGSMSKTIDDFRQFFNPNKKKQNFQISKVINDSLALIEESLHNHSIIIKKDIKDFEIYGFENELVQVLLILISNAKDALTSKKIENPQIEIKTYFENSEYIIKISDNAKGIDKKIINKIFDPYFTTKEEGKGTGIGLYMSKIIIENNMNGKLEVENDDKGAVFIIRLNESLEEDMNER